MSKSSIFYACILISVLALFPVESGPNTETWIGNSMQYIGNKTLKQLTLPGTHDSGTYWLSDVPLPGDGSNIAEAATIVAESLFVPTY